MDSFPKIVYARAARQDGSITIVYLEKIPGTGQFHTQEPEHTTLVFDGEPIVILEPGKEIWSNYYKMLLPDGVVGWVFDDHRHHQFKELIWYRNNP